MPVGVRWSRAGAPGSGPPAHPPSASAARNGNRARPPPPRTSADGRGDNSKPSPISCAGSTAATDRTTPLGKPSIRRRAPDIRVRWGRVGRRAAVEGERDGPEARRLLRESDLARPTRRPLSAPTSSLLPPLPGGKRALPPASARTRHRKAAAPGTQTPRS